MHSWEAKLLVSTRSKGRVQRRCRYSRASPPARPKLLACSKRPVQRVAFQCHLPLDKGLVEEST